MAHRSINALSLEWVRAFEVAGRTGSFTAAANETGLTQAAISQRIGNLEAQIGVQLFVRKARGIDLTVEGEAWLPYVASALALLDQSAEELFASQRRRIVIAASASVTQQWFVPRLRNLSAESKLQISFSTMVVQSDFQHHGAAVEVRYGDGSRLSGDYRARLFREVLGPVATPQLAASDKNWQLQPKLALSGPRQGWQDWARQTGDMPTPVPQFRFDSFIAALAAARAGLGVLLGSLPLCSEELDNGSLVRLCENQLQPEQTYWMIASKDSVTQRQWDWLTRLFCQNDR